MDIHPPIEKRTKEQLWEIIETREEWKDEVVIMAQEELIKRGISIAIKKRGERINSNIRTGLIPLKAELPIQLMRKC